MRISNIIVSVIFLLILSACAASQLENPSVNFLGDDGVVAGTLTAQGLSALVSTTKPTSTMWPTATPSPTPIPPTSTLTPTASPTPEPLAVFSSSALRIGITPITYIDDQCVYLENRWGEDKSEPGTIVVPFMFHSVAKPGRGTF